MGKKKIQTVSCSGWMGKYGWNTGFDCPVWGDPGQDYCCSQGDNHFCCKEPTTRQQGHDNDRSTADKGQSTTRRGGKGRPGGSSTSSSTSGSTVDTTGRRGGGGGGREGGNNGRSKGKQDTTSGNTGRVTRPIGSASLPYNKNPRLSPDHVTRLRNTRPGTTTEGAGSPVLDPADALGYSLIGGVVVAAILFLLCLCLCCYKCSWCPWAANKSNRKKSKSMSTPTTTSHPCPNCQRRQSFTTIDTMSTQQRCQCRDCYAMSSSIHCPILSSSQNPTPLPTPSDPYLQGLMDGTNWRNDTLQAHNMDSPMHHVPLTSQTTPTTPAPILAANPQLLPSTISVSDPTSPPTSPLTSPSYKPYPGGAYPLTPVAAPTLPRGRGLYPQRSAHNHQQHEHNPVDDCDASVSDTGKTTSSRDSWTGSESTVLCMTTFRPLSSTAVGQGHNSHVVCPLGGVNGMLGLPVGAGTGGVGGGLLPTIVDVDGCSALASRRDSGVLIEEDSPYDSSNNSGSNVGGVSKCGSGWADKVREAGGRAKLAAQAMGAIGAGMMPVQHASQPRNPYDRDS